MNLSMARRRGRCTGPRGSRRWCWRMGGNWKRIFLLMRAVFAANCWAERWKSLFKEDENSQFLPVVHFAEAAPEAPFSRVKSPQMRPRTLKEVGAELAVPMPADDDR